MRVLKGRVVTYRRELERQICEVGFNFYTAPPGERPEPEHFSRAMQALIKEGAVREMPMKIGAVQYMFWASPDASDDTAAAVLERKFNAFRVYHHVEQIAENSGYYAEQLHHKAILEAGYWGSVGWRPGQAIKTLDQYTIAERSAGDIDLAGHHLSSGVRFACQVKNGREWIYPTNKDFWNLLGGAAQLHAVPVFIQRRVPDFMYTVMKLVGGFAVRATKQILPPRLHDERPIAGMPSVAEALKELGFYSDVDFIDAPVSRHYNFWTGGLHRDIAAAWERFEPVIDDVLHIAYEERLAPGVRKGRVSGRPVKEIVGEFILKISARIEEEERMDREEREAEEKMRMLESIDSDDIPF